MNYADYAKAKLKSYESLGWKTEGLKETATTVEFFTIDLTGIKRSHFFSANDLKVEIVKNDAPVVEDVPAVEPETVFEPITEPETVVEEAPKKKTRKTKKTETK